MKKILYTAFLFIFFSLGNNTIAQITVTIGQSANQLAQKLVGSGVTISGATLTSQSGQSAKFTATANAFPFTDGIVLTSGSASGVKGQNNPGTHVSKDWNAAGDTWLELLLPIKTPPLLTHDACILEFDLIPNGDSIFFNYIFSSEEYNGYVCTDYTDIFGFKLSGPGIIGYKNIALVPLSATSNQNVPVAINTINNGIPSAGGNISNCQLGPGSPYTAYYHNNANNPYMSHFGRTVVMTAKAKVTRCVKYHLKLAIADVNDGIYDSGVFLEAGSLKSTSPASLSITNSYIDTNKQVLVERCHPLGYVKVNRNIKVDTTKALTLNFTYGGTATYGVDYTATSTITFPAYKTIDSFPINVIDDGIGDDNETILIKMQQAGCTSGFADSIPLKIIEHWTTGSTSKDTVCYPSQKQIKSLYADSLNTTFLWNTGDTTKSINAPASGLYTSQATHLNTCYQNDTFNIKVDSLIVNNTIKNYSTCSTDSVVLSYTVNQPTTSHTWSTGNSVDSIIKVNTTGNYVMTCTNNRGCVATDTSFIKYISNTVLMLPPTVSFCTGDSVLLTASTDLGLKYKWSNGDTTNAIWVKNTGTYSVIAQANGCIAYDTTVVTSKPVPSVSLPTNIQKCNGDSIFLDATSLSGCTYLWNTKNNTNPSFWVNTSGQYIVTVDLNGCSVNDTSDITFYNTPVLNLPAVKNICAGDSVLLDATTFTGTSYLWSNGATTPTIYANANASYFVKATLGVCNAYDTTVVSVIQYPTLNLPPTASSCLGDSVKLDATNAVGTIYTWSDGSTTPINWIKSTGTFIVIASLNGCASSDTTVAVFNKTPVINLPKSRDTCQGKTIVLDATTFAGTSYAWSTGEITPSINVNTAGTYFVKANLGVCNAYDTTVVSITQYPTLNLQPNVLSCLGDSVKLDATNAVGTIYTWNNGATTPTVWIKSTGTYIVTASLNTCATSDTTVAVFNKTPVLNLPKSRDTCQGKTILLDATTFAGTIYTWSTGEITPSIKVSTAGTYFVKASLGVCDAYDTTVVSITQYPTLNIQPNVLSCLGDSAKLDATNATGTIYTWNNGATTPTVWIKSSGTYIVTASLNTCATSDTTVAVFNKTPILNLPKSRDTCQGKTILLDATTFAGTTYKWNTGEMTPSINVSTAGTYFVKASLGICDAYDTTVVSITQYPILNLQSTVLSCLGDSVKLDATNAAGTIYTWSNGATTPTVWIKSTGTYTVTTDLNSCITKDTSTVIFGNPPQISLQHSVGFCDGDSAILNAVSNIATSKYLWSTGEITSAITVKTAGTYLVEVKANNCTSTDTTLVTVYNIPTVDAGQDLYVMATDLASFKATSSNDVISYTWTPSFNLSSDDILQPTILKPVDTTYKLFVSNGQCTNYDTVHVIVLSSFTIPNVFSPNGDGVNDTWEIKGLENYTGITVDVFDRYGRLVFSRRGYHKAWDGTYEGQGNPLAVGTYYYIIDIKRGKPLMTGSITILR